MATKETKSNKNDLLSYLAQQNIEKDYRDRIGFDTLESDYNKLMSKISLNQSKVKSKSFISPEENDALSKEIEAMRKRMQAYNDYLGYVGADSKATEGVTSTIGNLSGVTEMLKSQRELYGKYKTADDWYNYIKESEEAQKQYDTAMSYDIDAGQKNVDALKTTMDEAAKLTYENERRLQALQAAVGKPNYKFLSSEYTKWYEQNKDKIAANEKAYNDAKAAYEKALAEHNSNVESKRFYEKETEYRKLAQNPDYDALSGKANTEWYNIGDTSLAAKQGNGGAGAKALGFIDNVVDKYGDIALLLAINPGTAAFALPVNIAEWFLDKGADRRAAYDELEDDERKIFNYVFNTEGEKAAGEYLDHMRKTLEYRRAQTDKAKLDKEISKAVSWVPGEWAEEVAEVPAYGLHGLKTGVESAIPNMVAGVLNKELDTSRNEYLLGKINEEGNVVSKAAANVGQSIGNMAPSIVVAAALQGLGIPTGWASAASSVQMGLQARGSAYNEALRAGYTKEQASTYATVNGALEATLQYALNPAYGLSGKLVSKGIAKFAPNVVKSIAAMEKGVLRYVTAFSIASASSAGSEAIEEGIQAALDPYVRQILLGEDNDGIDWGEVGYSALLGGVTGGLMGAGTIVNDTKLPQLKKEAFAKNYDTAKGKSAEQRFSVYANKLTEENSAILKSVCELVNKGDVKGAIKQLDTAIARYGYAAEYARQEMQMRGDYFTKGQDQMQELKARIKDGKFNTAAAETVLRNESEVYQTVAEINDGVAKTLLDKSLSNSKIEKTILNDVGTAKAFERLTGINLSQYNTLSAKRNAIREAAIAYQQISDTDAVKSANELITKNNTEASASRRSDNRVEAQKILNEEIVKTRKEAKTSDKETAKKANIKERILNNIKNAIRNDETIKLASVDGSVPVSKAGKKASVSSGEISIETDMAKAKEGIYEEYLAPFDTVGDSTVDEIEAEVLKNINEKIENTKGEERKALIEQKQKVKEYAKLIKGRDEEVLDYAKQKSEEALQRKEKRFKQILKKNGLDLDVEQGGYLYYNKDEELITEKEYNALREKGEKVKVLTKNGFASGNTIHLFSNIAFGRWFKHIDPATGIMVTSRSGFDVSASEIVDFIIGHELVHAGERNGDGTVNKVLNSIKGTKADRYYEIAKRMKGEKTSEEADKHWNALKDIYVRAESSKMSRAKAEEKVTDEYIYEEIAADYVGSAFLDSGTLDRTLANRGIVDYLVIAARTLGKLLKGRKLNERSERVSVLMDNLTAMVNQTYKLHPETAQKTTESPVAKESSEKVKTTESKETTTEDEKNVVTDGEKMSVSGESSETADTSKLQRVYEKTSQNVNTNFSLSLETDGVVETANGDPVAVDEGNGSTKWSLSTYEEEGRDNLAKYLKNKKKDKSLTQKDVDDIMTSMDEIYDICKNFEDEYATFGAWSKAKVEYDKDGNPVFSVVKANGEYKMNLDFSLVCKKRRALDTVFNRLIEMGKINTFDFGQEEIVRINDIIRDHGFEVACALCFVDAKRYRQQKVADDFVELYNGLVESLDKNGVGIDYFNFGGDPSLERIENGIDTLSNDELDFTEIDRVIKTEEKESVLKKAAMHLKNHPEDRKLLSRGDFMSSKGFGEVKKQNPAILSLYNSKKGTGGPKAAFGDVQYMNEIIKSTTFKPKKAYSVGGVRIQSFSDYVARLVFDYVQMVGDLAAKKLPAHAYTKEALFVKQFGLTGIKINMSLIPEIGDGKYAGLNADGSYAWASESFPIDEAFAIQDDAEYGRNCGTIAVGVSDEHIRKLLNDPKIRMVIPYHKSGINPIVAHMMKIEGFTDYTSIQNTTHRDGTKISDDEAKGMPNFNELMHKGMSPVEASRVYVEWCEKNGYRPKFPQFAYVIKNGQKVFNENYYKLLEDFTTSFNGETVAQEAVKMRFPDENSAFGSMKDLIQQGLNEDDIRQGELDENVDAIVSEIAEMLGDDEKMSVSAEEDTEYLSLAKDPVKNEARLRYLVNKVAKENGYEIKGYHGTGDKITVFSVEKTNSANDFGQGIYFTSSEKEAQRYYNDDTHGDTYNKIYGVAYDNAIARIDEMGEDASDELLFDRVFNEEFDKELQRRTDEGAVISAYLKMENPFVVSRENKISVAEAIDIARNTMYVEDVPNEASISDWVHSIKRYAEQHDGYVDTFEFANNMGHSVNLTNALMHQGKYDGIVDYSVSRKFRVASDYHAIALYPNKIKDASIVTYDDNGNVIPLSERFNPENEDIRYSVSEADETDSRGKRLTTQQVEFFKDSKIRDRRGDLLRVYHATNADFTVFDKAKIGGKNGALFGRGFYFSKDESQAMRYGRNVGEFYLNIKKPFDYLNFKKKDVVRILEESGYDYNKRLVNYFDYSDTEDVDLISDLLEDALTDVDVYATFSDMVQKAGYDGIVAGREIIAFEPEQIKRTDNKNPTSDPDVRYSVTEVEEETAPTYAQLKRELEKQIKRNEKLSEELVQTHGKKLDTKLAKERLEEIVKRYGGDIKASKIVEKYKDAYEYIYYGRLRETNEDGAPAVHKNGKPKYTENAELNVETANKMVDDLAREIIDSAVAYDEDIDTYRAVLKDVRKTAITVPESVKESGFEDVGGWNEFRKKSYGNIRFVNNNGADISTVYNSLATNYPEMFPDGVTDPAKQIKRIAEVTREIRQSGILPKSIYSDVEVQSVLEDVKSDLFDLMADKEVRKVTKADEYADTKTELKKTKSEARANKEVAQGLSWRLAEQKLADDIFYGKKIAEIRRRRDEQISYLRERFNDRMSERSESQKRLHQEKMAIKRFNDLTNRLTHPTKTKHVPEAMANDLALFLNRTVLSTRTKANAEARDKIIASLDSYFDAKQKKGNTIEWSQISDENAGRFSDELLLDMKEYGVGNFDRMNSDELHNYNNLLLRIIHEINTEDKLFHSGESASVAAQKAKRQFMQLAKNNSKINWLEGFIKDQKYFASDPESFFTNLGIDELTSAYHRLSARQDVFARTLRTLTDKLGEIVDGAIPKGWREHTYDFTTENGQTIRLTKAKAMTIYLLSKQEASRKRLLNEKGGVVPTDTSVNYLHLEESATRTDKNGNPKKELVLPKTTILANMGGSPAVLTEGDLDLIEFSLGDRAKDVADKISSLLNNEVSELGNEVALALEGYKKFGVENYFPMMVAENGKTYEQIVKDTDAQIRNKSFTKDRTGSAGVALVADDVFNVVERHLLGMSQYYAYEEALRDFQKIYTMRPGGEASLRLTMNSRLSSNSAVHKFIANFIDSLQGAQMKAGEEKLLSEKLLGHYKAAQIGLNLSVVAKQPTAFIRALPELSAKGVVVGSLNPKKLFNFSKDGFRSDIKEMVENSGLAQMKAWGFSEYGSALSVGELYDKNAGDWEKKLNNIVSKPAEFADLITWAAIWRACKTASNSMEETVEKFNDVIRKTQVVSSAFTSTQIANQGGMSKLAFAFKNEPLKTFNYARATLFDALEGKEGARKKAVKVAAATLLNTFVVAMISSGFSLMRDDEEDKWEDFWSRVGDNMLSDVLNNVFIFAGDIYAAVESGLDNKDVERMDLAPIVDAVQIAKRLVDPPKNYTPARAINDISKALSGITGIPLSNITRAGKTLHGRLAEIIDTPEMWYEYNKVWNNVKGDKATFKAILTDALNTDYNAFVSIKNDLVKHGYTQTDIDNAVKNSDRFVTAWNDSPEAFRKELNEAQKIDKMFSSDYVIKMMDKRRSDIVGDLFELMMKGEKITAAEKKTAAEKREEILNFRDPKSKRLTTEKTLNELLEDKAMSKMRSDVNNIVLTSDLDIDKKLEEIFKRYEKFGVKLSDVKKVAREKDKL